MWFWDYTPSGWGRPKPLTKTQIRKLQEAYLHAGAITEEVRKKEQEEQCNINNNTESLLKYI